VVTLVCLLAPVLIVLGLPATWLMVAAAVAIKGGALIGWWPGLEPMFDWWTIGVVAALALLADITDTVAGSLGAKRAGGSRRSYIGAILGGIPGAIAGTFMLPVPLVGTLAGGAIGAGLGATLFQLTSEQHTIGSASKVGAGAAAGWLVAVIIKLVIALIVGVILVTAAWID
jgi:uncharacterized protein YqgC (DUF456 family)